MIGWQGTANGWCVHRVPTKRVSCMWPSPQLLLENQRLSCCTITAFALPCNLLLPAGREGCVPEED
jgi:hypothetical protein